MSSIESTTSDSTPVSFRLTGSCPHCGGVIDCTCSEVQPPIAVEHAPPVTVRRSATAAWLRYLLPLSTGWAAAQTPATAPAATNLHLERIPAWLRWILALLPIVLGIGWVAASGTLREQHEAPVAQRDRPIQATSTAVPVWTAEQSAVLDVVTAYNAADSLVASTLRLDPIVPFVDPSGPLFTQRQAALTRRQHLNAAYATHLVRWTVGAVILNPTNTQATVTTQETWEARAPEQAPQTATVRVVYTLKRPAATAAWQIYAAERLNIDAPAR